MSPTENEIEKACSFATHPKMSAACSVCTTPREIVSYLDPSHLPVPAGCSGPLLFSFRATISGLLKSSRFGAIFQLTDLLD